MHRPRRSATERSIVNCLSCLELIWIIIKSKLDFTLICRWSRSQRMLSCPPPLPLPPPPPPPLKMEVCRREYPRSD